MSKATRYQRPLALAISFLFCAMVAAAQMPDLKPLPTSSKVEIPTPQDPNNFIFVVAGDNRPATRGPAQPKALSTVIDCVKNLRPDFVLWTGDTIYGKNATDPDEIRAEYAEFLKIAALGTVPVFNAPGNHELDDKDNNPSPQMLQLYTENMSGAWGAFSYGNSHFIALNSENNPPKGNPAAAALAAKKEAPGYITPDQLQALDADLANNKNMAHIFIFMHHPVKPAKKEDGLVKESVEALKAVFKKYKNVSTVSYVLSGHEHMYYNPQHPKNITKAPGRTDPSWPPTYLVSGGAGAPLKKLPGGFYHYLVFTVSGGNIIVALKPLGTPTGTCPQ